LAAASTPWRHPLCLANGGVWRQRIAIIVTNRLGRPVSGTPVPVRVGQADGEARLAGREVRDLRVCNDRGDEMLFAVSTPDGVQLRRGIVPSGGTLTIPVECPSNGEARYEVYFDNPRAWEPPDALEATGALRNGGVEDGAGDTPAGWSHDPGDAQHVASWTSEEARSGRKSLKLGVTAGAEPSWIATRQSGLRIAGGLRYRMTAWVKARAVVGYAGWYVHLGNAANPMIEAPMLPAGDGDFDWRQVTLEFTAPADADRADLGTVLRGTGTAWFDDVTLQAMEAEPAPKAWALKPERIALTVSGGAARWWAPPGLLRSGRVRALTQRVPMRIVNLSDAPVAGYASVQAALVDRRGRAGVHIVANGREVPHYRLGDALLFRADVAARAVGTAYAYRSTKPAVRAARKTTTASATYAPNPAVPGGSVPAPSGPCLADYRSLLSSGRNLARNGGFEEGGHLPAAWAGGSERERPAGAVMDAAPGGLFGRRCGRIHVPAGSTPAWTGWRQDVTVQPDRTYLFAAWLRCDKLEGSLQLHAHLRTRSGDPVRQNPMQSAGPPISGTTGWTLISGIFRTPPDCRIFQMHLTMLATGTAWHDGALLLEMLPDECLEPETRPGSAAPALAAWPVNPVVKVFRDDEPPMPGRAGIVRVSCASNEYEPVQLAVRSSRDLRDVRVVVDAPRSRAGAALRDWEIGVVDFVPVDVVTNYYSDRMPPYYRKVPRGAPGSDGWPGWWPDPILPRDRVDLVAGRTQPIWLTLRVPPGTSPGAYRGAVRLTVAGRTVSSLPLSVRGRGFELPPRASLKAIFDCRQSGEMWRVPGKSETESREDFWRFMARRRVCPDTVRPEPVLAYRNGAVEADFTEFDRAARLYFDELKFPHAYTPWHFYLFGWGHLPGDKFGEKPYPGEYPYEGADRSKLRPEFKRAYQACLKAYWDHVKAMGWADRIVLYISDEPTDSQSAIVAQMSALCDMIHEVDPAIPIYSSTWHHQPAWDGKLDVWGIGHYGLVPVEKMDALRRAGARLWWTTDGQMCTDTPYCAIERLLPHYCFKYGADAYEFWGIDWLTYDPYRRGWHAFLPHDFGPGTTKEYVRYPNGDGFLAYPPGPLKLTRPVTSVRLEQAREGVEDYEYLLLLRKLVADGKVAGRNVAKGEAALLAADALVQTPCEIGRYSTKILPDPDRVLRVRDAVAMAIEELSPRSAP